jgi:hypothetical protein
MAEDADDSDDNEDGGDDNEDDGNDDEDDDEDDDDGEEEEEEEEEDGIIEPVLSWVSQHAKSPSSSRHVGQRTGVQQPAGGPPSGPT